MTCHCEPRCPEGISFADHFFNDFGGLLSRPRLGFDDEWEQPFREGDRVYVVHNGERHRVVSHYGDFISSICELRRETRLLIA